MSKFEAWFRYIKSEFKSEFSPSKSKNSFKLQLQNMSLMCSNNVTVVLAVERFIAVTRPIEYHVNVTSSGQSPWRRVSAYMVPTILFSIAFNVPKFFEIKGVPDIKQVRIVR